MLLKVKTVKNSLAACIVILIVGSNFKNLHVIVCHDLLMLCLKGTLMQIWKSPYMFLFIWK